MTLGPAFDSVLTAARSGEEWAWTALYLDLAGPVRGYLAGRGSPEPEDEASETFLHVARGIGRFTGTERDFRAWVFSIAHRRMVDAHRRARVRPVAAAGSSDEVSASELAPSAEQQVLLRYGLEGARELLAGLSEDQRQILLLRVVGELSVRETAAVIGKSESAVKVAQHRAIQALRRAAQRQHSRPGGPV
ncbi:RNA polymerase sigma factor [Demequina mangrovi]|uniref:RNA polymerase sigma-70 factor, ECF subfamily n=1 Tax=Demequina mangrovi TaxID=1043493 RepID=A0A1H6VK06_9MICO|nr:sigma-70 family RNA polymerase sigma factor [Demequina mangrovi]SEJ00682.1 RNA polymerase sigma-70 factor, ECF subfamily [Demequina mangrovi]